MLAAWARWAYARGGSAYQTTKFAMSKSTEFVMTGYVGEGVLCYAVHPGGVTTQLAENMPKQSYGGMLFFLEPG